MSKVRFEKNCFTGFALLALLLCETALATSESPQGITLQGRFLTADGSAPITKVVDLTLSILSPDGTCLLYQESQSGIDLSTTDGMYNVLVGSSVAGLDAAKRTLSDPHKSMAVIFSNQIVPIRTAGANCASGYTPAVGHTRLLRITVTPNGEVPITLSPDMTIGSVPQAMVAETLQGLPSTSFIQALGNVSQTTVSHLTNGSDASDLHNHDSYYVKIGATGNQNLGSGINYTTGSIGIGTSAPTSDLGFGGNQTRTIQTERNSAGALGSDFVLKAGGAATGVANLNGGSLILSSGVSTGTGTSTIQFKTSDTTGAGTTDNAATTKMTILGNGRVGIGAPAPVSQLHVVSGAPTTVTSTLQGAAVQTGNLLDFRANDNTLLSYFDKDGNLFLHADPTLATHAATKNYVDTTLATRPMSTALPTLNQIMTWDGASWTPTTVVGGLGYTPVNKAGDTMTGALDISAAGTGLTVEHNASIAGTLNMNNKEILSMKLENLAVDPVAANAGRLYYNTVSGLMKYDTGAAIKEVCEKDSTQTFTNKSLSDTTTAIVDSVDPTIQLKFDAAGTGTTSTTLTTSQTANRVITLPDATTTLMGASGTVPMTGALDLGSHLIHNVTDPAAAQDASTRAYVDNVATNISNNYVKKDGTNPLTANWPAGNFTITANSVQLGSAANTVAGLATIVNGLGTLTLPTTTDNLVGRATTDIFSNKTISGLTNTFTNIPDTALSANVCYLDGTRPLTANWPAGAFTITANSVQLGSAANTVSGLATIVNGAGTLTLPTTTDTIVGRNTTDTLTNKSLKDTTTAVVDAVDPTIQVKIDAAGTTGTSTTLTSSQTANRVITLPDATTTLMGASGTVPMTGALDLGTHLIHNVTDPAAAQDAATRAYVDALSAGVGNNYVKKDGTNPLTANWPAGNFTITSNSVQLGSAANTVAGLATIVNGAGTLTLPTTTDTVVGRATTDILTNKTISGLTNTFTNIPDSALSANVCYLDGTRPLTANWNAGAFRITANSVQVGSAANTVSGLATIVNGAGTLTLPTTTDTVLGRNTTDTLTNKSLSDTTTAIIDSVDPSIKILFNAAGNAATTTTITSAQTANRVITLPNSTTTLMGADGLVPMTGALDMGTHVINNVTDPTLAQDAATKHYVDTSVGVGFLKADGTIPLTANWNAGNFKITANSVQLGSAANTIDGLATIVNGAGTLTLPTSTDTMVGRATTDILTNKTISGATNTFTNIPDTALSTNVCYLDGTRPLTANWNAGTFKITANSVQLGSAANTIAGVSTLVNGAGTLTLPSSTDTLVGLVTTDTLTNKSMSGATNTFTNIPDTALSTNIFYKDGTRALTGALDVGTHLIHNVTDPAAAQDAATRAYVDAVSAGVGTNYVKKDGTSPLTANWPAGNFTITANSVQVGSATNTIAGVATLVNGAGTLTLPSSTDVILGRDTTDTLTNKSISGATNTLTNIPDSALSTNILYKDGTRAMTGAFDMGTHLIHNVTDPAVAQDAATKHYVDTSVGVGFVKADGTVPLTAAWNAGAFKITANSVQVGSAANTITGLATVVNGAGTLTLPTSTDTLVGLATTDTLTNKTISGATNTISNIPDSALTTNIFYKDGSRAMAGTLDMGTHVISNVTDPGSAQDAATKHYVDTSVGVGFVKADGTIPLTANWAAGAFKITANAVQVGSAANTIAGVSTLVNGAGTLTLPSSTDTLVGLATTDTLTNKSMSGATNTFTNIPDTALSTNIFYKDGTRALTGALDVGTHLIHNVTDPAAAQDAATRAYVDAVSAGVGTNYVKKDGTSPLTADWAAGAFKITANSVQVGSAANTVTGLATIINGAGTLTLPSTTDNILGRATTDTLTNKSISGATNTLTNIPDSALSTNILYKDGTRAMTGAFDMGTHVINNVTDPTLAQDAATKHYVDTTVGVGFVKADGTVPLTANWSAGAFKITANSVQVGSAASTIAGISTLVNGAGTLTLPSSTDTLTGRATTDTLTNKTISGATNTISNIPDSALTTNIFYKDGTRAMAGTLDMGTHVISNVTDPGSAQDAATKHYVDTSVGVGFVKADGTIPLTANWAAGAFKITANSVQLGSAANTIAGVSTLVNGAGTLTLPSSTDTLVGLATTDTLTNKSMSGASNTFTNIPDSALSTNIFYKDGTRALTGALDVGTHLIHNVTDPGSAQDAATKHYVDTSVAVGFVKADGTIPLTADWSAGAFKITANSVQVGSAANTIAGVSTLVNGAGTLTLPSSTDTLVGLATTNTLTNKSMSGATNTFTNIPDAALSSNIFYKDGTRALTGALDVGTHLVHNVSDPAAAQDAATRAYVDSVSTGVGTNYVKKDGTSPLTADWAAGAYKITANSVQLGSAANTITGLSTIINGAGTLTLPSSTDTIVGRATTDLLTNKTINGSSNTLTNIPDTALSTNVCYLDGSRPLTANWNAGSYKITANSVQLGSAANTIAGVSTLVNGAGTLTLPSSTDTLVGRTTSETLTNKTMSGASNTFTNIPDSALTSNILYVDGSRSLTGTLNSEIILPKADNTYSLGDASFRFTSLWATDSSINTSDRRQKTSIQESKLGLDFINKIKPVSYQWKTGRDLASVHYGVIAQDIEELVSTKEFGGLVHDEKADIYGIRYTEFISPMIKAIQELAVKVKELYQDRGAITVPAEGSIAGKAMIIEKENLLGLGDISNRKTSHVACVGAKNGKCIASGTARGALQNAVAGEVYYLGSNGEMVQEGKINTSAHSVRIGIAINSTDLLVRIQD